MLLQEGAIFNLASIAGVTAIDSQPVYACSKAGLRSWSTNTHSVCAALFRLRASSVGLRTLMRLLGCGNSVLYCLADVSRSCGFLSSDDTAIATHSCSDGLQATCCYITPADNS